MDDQVPQPPRKTEFEQLVYLQSQLSGLPKGSQQELRQKLVEKLIKLARDNFYVFVCLMAPTQMPDDFTPGRHIEVICHELQRLEEYIVQNRPGYKKKRDKTLTGRVEVALPPGSMKSILSRLFMAWVLGRHPKWRVLAVGHGRDFVIDNIGRPVRDMISSEEYREIFPNISIKEDADSAGRWITTDGGQFYAAGAGTKISGRRAHISICDDVVSEQEADSEKVRNKINRWYGKGLQSRLLPGSAELLIGTRWHIEDLNGYVVEKYTKSKRPFRRVIVPAILDQKGSDLLRRPTDPEGLYEVGTSYWPEFWALDALEATRDGGTLLPSEWAALYMQNPVPEEGNIVKNDHFKIWKYPDMPECKYLLLSVDTAFGTTTQSNYSAYTLWGIFDKKESLADGREVNVPQMILVAAAKGRWEFPDLCNRVHAIYKKKHVDAVIIEKKASGQSLLQEMRRRGVPVMEYMPDRDKMSRLFACTPIFSSGRIWIPEGYEWARQVVLEVVSFPFAANDDYTDTVSQAVLWMRDSYQIHHDDYQSFAHLDEDDYSGPKVRKTYWDSVIGQVATRH